VSTSIRSGRVSKRCRLNCGWKPVPSSPEMVKKGFWEGKIRGSCRDHNGAFPVPVKGPGQFSWGLEKSIA